MIKSNFCSLPPVFFFPLCIDCFISCLWLTAVPDPVPASSAKANECETGLPSCHGRASSMPGPSQGTKARVALNLKPWALEEREGEQEVQVKWARCQWGKWGGTTPTSTGLPWSRVSGARASQLGAGSGELEKRASLRLLETNEASSGSSGPATLNSTPCLPLHPHSHIYSHTHSHPLHSTEGCDSPEPIPGSLEYLWIAVQQVVHSR